VNGWRKLWSLGWRLGLCALLLVWIFHSIFTNEGRLAVERDGGVWDHLATGDQWRAAWQHGPRELWRTLCLLPPGAFVTAFLLVGATILLGVIRWRRVLRVQGLHLSFGRAAEISLIAQFFNTFLLGSTGGDLLKAYYAARETHHKKAEAVTTVFADRVIGLLSMLLFACLMMLPNLELLRQHDRLGTIAGFIGLMTLGGCLGTYVAFWGGVSRRFPRARALLRRLPKGEALERSLDACREFGRDQAFLGQAIGLSMLLNLLVVAQLAVLANGLGLNVSFRALLVIVPIVICISALPITPSGLGVRENLFVLMLAVPEINVPATLALSLSLLAYAGNLAWSLIGGVVYICVRKSEHLEEVTRADGNPEPGP
jgi:glycosyltransferase 2 family protein